MSTVATTGKSRSWPGILALAVLLALPVSILMVRGGLWQPGLALYALSCLSAAILLLVFVVSLLLRRTAGRRRQLLMQSLMLVPGTVLLLSVLAGGGDYPAIHDITTDLSNPPVFTQAPLMRSSSENSLAISEETLQLQREAYPDITPIESSLSFDEAFSKALAVAETLGWSISASDPDTGLIEATVTTRIMAFKDDVVIRVWSREKTTRIDLRSASRVGVSDMGANAKRIRRFTQLFSS